LHLRSSKHMSQAMSSEKVIKLQLLVFDIGSAALWHVNNDLESDTATVAETTLTTFFYVASQTVRRSNLLEDCNLPLLEGRMAGGSVPARKLSQRDQPRKAAIKIVRTMFPGPPGTFSAFLSYWTFAVHAGRESMASSWEHQSLHHSYGWCSKLYTYLAMCEDQSIYSVLLTKPDSRYVTCFLLPGVSPRHVFVPWTPLAETVKKEPLWCRLEPYPLGLRVSSAGSMF
jgi:hypothetical protein